MPAAPAPAPRLGALDAMRGYAIAGVVLAHTAQWTRPAADWAQQLCANGALGVQLFFVASAFALFSSHEQHRGDRRPVADFFVRRFFRVAPMFYVGLVSFLLIAGLRPRLWAPRGLTSLDIGLTAFFLHGWHPETINAVVPGGWSIAAEVMFYLLLPFLFRLLTTRAAALGWLAFTLLLGHVMNLWVAPLLTPGYPEGYGYLAENFRFFWVFGQLPVFACGIFLYFLLRTRLQSAAPWVGWAALGGAAALGATLFWKLRPPLPLSLAATVGVGAACMLFGLALCLTRSALLVNRPVIFLGKISYSLYFAHFAVFQFIFAHWRGGLGAGGPLATPLAFLLVLAVAGVISFLTWRWIELPGIALGRRIVARLEANAAKANGAEKSAPSLAG